MKHAKWALSYHLPDMEKVCSIVQVYRTASCAGQTTNFSNHASYGKSHGIHFFSTLWFHGRRVFCVASALGEPQITSFNQEGSRLGTNLRRMNLWQLPHFFSPCSGHLYILVPSLITYFLHCRASFQSYPRMSWKSYGINWMSKIKRLSSKPWRSDVDLWSVHFVKEAVWNTPWTLLHTTTGLVNAKKRARYICVVVACGISTRTM